MIELFYTTLNQEFEKLTVSERKIINEVWEHKSKYIQWPAKARLLWSGCVRVRESYKYSDEIRMKQNPRESQLIRVKEMDQQ